MKINLGSGNDYRNGWVNVDRGACKHDVDHDLFVFPWPFETSSVDEIWASHILEHFSRDQFLPMVRELYRICKGGARIEAWVPYAGSDNFWTDPTHQMPFTVRTFDFFDDTKPLRENGLIYGWGDVKFLVSIANKVDNPPNGPDVHFIMTVQK